MSIFLQAHLLAHQLIEIALQNKGVCEYGFEYEFGGVCGSVGLDAVPVIRRSLAHVPRSAEGFTA